MQASIAAPGTDGEKYTPTSGIWQTVWLESLPQAGHISELAVVTNLTTVTVIATLGPGAAPHAQLRIDVESAPGRIIASATAACDGGSGDSSSPTQSGPVSLAIPSPKLWSPDQPFLYNFTASLSWNSGGAGGSSSTVDVASAGDVVHSYFGLRTISLGPLAGGAGGAQQQALHLNGKRFFASGWLDQSWWPDGQYTAPTDEALAFDVQALKTYGFNMVRLHQKINPERWYFHADRAGVVVFQDMVPTHC